MGVFLFLLVFMENGLQKKKRGGDENFMVDEGG